MSWITSRVPTWASRSVPVRSAVAPWVAARSRARPWWPVLVLSLVLGIVATLLDLQIPVLIGHAMDAGIEAGNLGTLKITAMLIAAVVFATYLCRAAGGYLMRYTMEKTFVLVRQQVFDKLRGPGYYTVQQELDLCVNREQFESVVHDVFDELLFDYCQRIVDQNADANNVAGHGP
mgnify:CR=1 FL=1